MKRFAPPFTSRRINRLLAVAIVPAVLACNQPAPEAAPGIVPVADHVLSADNTHNKWSRSIEPVLTVDPGDVVDAFLVEASGGRVTVDSKAEDIEAIGAASPFHALTGPVYVRGAEPGDVLAVTLHEIEVQDWGWSAIFPGFGFLADEFTEPYMKIYRFEPGDTAADFGNGIMIPFRPFPGVMGVAPDTDSLLSTIPPRANGGNMDDKDIVEGTTVYFPVFVEGALFSLGDPHVAQGDGEVSGTAIEGSLRVVYEIDVIKGGRGMPSPQYETEDHYSVTGFGTTIDDAARMATRAMIDYLVSETGLSRTEAYVLASQIADLKIAETVDVPHMLATMRVAKTVIAGG